MKRHLAARVVAALVDRSLGNVQMVSGGLGEFTVNVDGESASRTNRLLYPTVARVVADVEAFLDKRKRG